MTTKHTPGPWRLQLWPSTGWEVTGPASGPRIATVYAPINCRPDAESIANAALIAAAPDMLAEIQRTEAALGENLQWLTDILDLRIRQGDKDAIKRLAQLNAAWIGVVRAITKATGST